MKRAAGFLLILLFATLVGITTSSGDETDNSHQVHLTATYGPQITCDTSCHVSSGPIMTTGGLFTDGENLTNTTVCDTCHSPLGAYDGVDDPNIGAKNNWSSAPPPSSLVFDGSGDFQTGKEKWCVGCHDGVPSVINSVSAPNMAGEFNSDCTDAGVPYSCCTGVDTGTCVDYGYYHTGHGKYVSESITCLACHDPDSEHVVDGVARTYSAVADNYQAGYRLKLVGGQAPLVIPRPLTAFTADQFRQCFSCHDSAPFMNFDNLNTNFRADVDDSCVAFVPGPKNRHWEHLSITEDKYDSDWDGVPADSPPSCPACHNVHGPRLRVGAGITNAPAMIRTGELIGRYNEGALDLDYFINPCPDPQLLSSTNEIVGSTGGMLIAGPDGNSGTIARNGVCDMCHTEAQPYWRAAKKLPANDFSLDGNAVALWSVENGALTTDSKGTNTLTDYNTVGTDTVDYKEFAASADFESSNSEYLFITDASLNSGFPLKSGESGTFSVTFWYKAESKGNYRGLVSKYDYTAANSKSLLLRDSSGTLEFFIGHTNGTNYELLDNTYTGFTNGQWYHIGATFNNTTKAWQLRVWGDTEGIVVHDTFNTATNNISINTDAPFAIGAAVSNGLPQFPIDGLMDEIVVFRDILTIDEIDNIRQGTYAEVFTPTTTTTLNPPTTTTTLPPTPNDFSGDGNAVALWSLENGALTTDSIGTNTLTDYNTVGSNTVDHKEFAASADFESTASQALTILDSALASGFPLRSGASGTFSITFWYKAESQGASRTLISKYDYSITSDRTLLLRDNNGTLEYYIGKLGSPYFETLDTSLSLSTGRWYHIGLTFNNTTKAWQLRVYDDSEAGNPLGEGIGVVLNASATATNNINITDAPFAIGAAVSNGTPSNFIDGLFDEIVVSRDILTTGEIDQIRQGGYSPVPPTTTTTLPPATTTTTTTLPPAQNDFSLDGNAVALWSVENGALTTDSKGTNTLTDYNTVGTDTVDYKEFAASADFESSNSEYLFITDASLNSGFPLKSGESGTFSVTFWYKAESKGNYRGLVSKYDYTAANSKSLLLRDSSGTLEFFIGHTNGTNYELLDNTYTGFTNGQWYHIGATFNNTTKAWQLRVWGDTEGIVVHDTFNTATNNISINTDAPFAIGAAVSNGLPQFPIDGLMDEIVVFRDILTIDEIDNIRQGTYAEVFTPTTTTTLNPPTTTTTLPPTPNDFSGDGNAVALWSLENGALTTDSIGTNTLTDYNTVGSNTVDHKEFAASADFESTASQALTILDSALASGFPLRSGASGTFSITFWYKAESQGASRTLISKYDYSITSDRTLLLRDNNGTLEYYIGKLGSPYFETLDTSLSLSTGRWYHIGLTFNNTTKAWQLRVYDDSEAGNPLGEGIGVVLNASATATNNINITDAPFAIGAAVSNGTPSNFIDGLFDEIVVSRDILTTGEIDQIRQGGYSPVPPTTTTTLPPATTTTTTTLPPAQNDFSLDGNAVALWSVENGALTTDSKGTNTLTDYNTVGTDTVDYKEFAASADFESSNSEYLFITDASLNSGFPLKSGESGTFSVTFWYKAESKGNYRGLVSKYDYTAANSKSLLLRDSSGTLEFYIGHTNGTNFELLDNTYTGFTNGQWYHIGATFNNTTKAWQLRVWGDTEGIVVHDTFNTATNNISINTDAPFAIGAAVSNGLPQFPIDGLMDKIVVFRDILTIDEIDLIRQGTYAEVFTPTTTTTTTTTSSTTTTTLGSTTTTTTTLPPTTTTTTLPGGTTTTTTTTTTTLPITLTEPDERRPYQRDTDGARDMTFSGTYNCSAPSAIKYRIVDDGTDTPVTGHNWQTLDASPSGGTFSGTAVDVPQGAWYNTDVRCDDSGTDVYNGTNKWGVGMVVDTTGQSNMEYWFTLGSDLAISDLVSVVYTSSGSPVLEALSASNSGNGARAFSNAIVNALGIPVLLVNAGYAGAGLTNIATHYWLNEVGTPYSRMINAMALVDDEAEFWLWNQGEADADALVSEADYESGMVTLAGRVRTALTNKSSETNLPLIISITGRYETATVPPSTGDTGHQNIRNAQLDTASGIADSYVGADGVTDALRDGIHKSDGAYTLNGTRMAQAVLDILGEETYHRGPQITGYTERSYTQTDVTITHNGGSDFTPLSGITGFEVAEDDVWETPSSAVRVDATTIRLTHSSMTGVRKARYLYGRNPTTTDAVYDNSSLTLPLESSR